MSLEELKKSFPRNYNIEKSNQSKVNELEESNELLKGKSHKEIFILSLVLGFKNKVSKKMNTPYGLINCSSFSSRDCWLVAAIGFKEKGLSIFNDPLELRKLAEGYANAGFDILQKKLYEEKPGNVLNHLESEIISLLDD